MYYYNCQSPWRWRKSWITSSVVQKSVKNESVAAISELINHYCLPAICHDFSNWLYWSPPWALFSSIYPFSLSCCLRPRGHLLATNTRSVLRSGLNGLKARLEWVQTNDRLYPWRKGKQSKRPIMSLFTVVQTWWQVQHEKREIRLLLLAELCANTKSNSHVHCQENENTDLKDKKNVFCFYCQP